jgi:peptidyl-prolyl cis-trans isomerase D
MLSGIRSAASTWLGKAVLFVLFGFLIVSFAIWGIGDIFRGYGSNTLATVGRTEIGVEAFRRAFQQRIYEIQQRSRGFTSEQARLLGVDRQVLNQMIGEAALDEQARRLGLAISQEEIARSLAGNAAFRGADGRFNRQGFDAYLREVGLSEGAFIAQQRQAALRQQLVETVTGGFAPPQALVEMLHRYRAEERTISYVVVPGAIPSALPTPTEEQLKALHEQRKAAYRAPEYRGFVALVLTPAEFAADVPVSDSELRQAYDRGIAAGRYGTAERRNIQQIVFPNVEEAAAAAERLKGGLAWEALLEERKLKAADVDLGAKTRTEIADAAIRDAAFALAEGAVSAPIQGAFGTVLLRVSAIEAGTAQPFEAVREALAADVRAEKLGRDREARRKLDAVHDKVEELRSSGKALREVASELQRSLVTIAATDAQGRDKAGAPIQPLPEQAEVIKSVFQSDRGVDNEAVRTRDGGYVWFEIQTIEPARERAFEEVRAQVDEAWRADEAARLTNESANAFLKRIEAGETLDAVAAELGVSVETAERVTRDGNDAVAPAAAAAAFALAPGKFAVAPTGQGADRMILRLDNVSTPDFKAEDQPTRELRAQLERTLSNELLDRYVAKAQADLGVSVNERAVASATGAQASR